MVERILQDLHASDNTWNIGILRYFNPVGAHESGLIGEDPSGKPNNLMPFLSQVAVGKRGKLSIFGDDYDTIDGTGVRDYIHVVDLAVGHVKALDKFKEAPGCFVVNLGTGNGFSVLQMVESFEKTNGVPIAYEIVERRQGDIATCYADTSLAASFIDWVAEKGLDDMMRDTWNWQTKNPDGYI
jgi:UDP-glucose 4-epimerase